MGRPGKLASGVLLLLLAATILIAGAQAPDPVALRVVAGAFGLPGFLLLMLGIIPKHAERGRMVFRPGRLVGGLGISALGVGVLYVYYQVVHVAPRAVVIGALLAVPAGLLFAASCWTAGEEDARRRTRR